MGFAHTVAYVEDTGGQIYGRGLCSGFLTVGWTEDTAVEDQAAAQAPSGALMALT